MLCDKFLGQATPFSVSSCKRRPLVAEMCMGRKKPHQARAKAPSGPALNQPQFSPTQTAAQGIGCYAQTMGVTHVMYVIKLLRLEGHKP